MPDIPAVKRMKARGDGATRVPGLARAANIQFREQKQEGLADLWKRKTILANRGRSPK